MPDEHPMPSSVSDSDLQPALAGRGLFEEKIAEIMKVYDLIYYIDMHVTEQEFSGYFDSLETLVKYFC